MLSACQGQNRAKALALELQYTRTHAHKETAMTSPPSGAWAPNPRQQSLLDEVRARGAVSVERLAQRLDVTMQTVRRDIQRLSEAGLLSRFHGGVSLPATTSGKPASPTLAWQERQALRADAKARLARCVAAAIPDGSTLFWASGPRSRPWPRR